MEWILAFSIGVIVGVVIGRYLFPKGKITLSNVDLRGLKGNIHG